MYTAQLQLIDPLFYDSKLCVYTYIPTRIYVESHYDVADGADEECIELEEVYQLSDTDRRSYEKVFSSILVPYTALTVGEEIGQGKCEETQQIRIMKITLHNTNF